MKSAPIGSGACGSWAAGSDCPRARRRRRDADRRRERRSRKQRRWALR
jgi:hypothetical protein